MGEISSELVTFKSSVEPNIGNMQSMCSVIKEKVQSVKSSTGSAKSGISNYYSSSNKSSVLDKMNYVGSVYDSIASSVNQLESLVSGAEGVIGKISELEAINAEIAKQQSIISNSKQDTDGDKSRRAAAQNIINQKNQEFDEKHEETKQALQALKSSDGSVSIDSGNTSSGAEVDLDNFEYGTFTKKTYTASNGVKFDYYIYIPKCETTEKLPVMLYMHGAGFSDTGDQVVTYCGLGEAVNNGTIKPSGIVIMPHIKNGRLYESKDVRDALAELPETICEQYKCDSNRISVGGVSYGGVTSYRLVAEHPGEFSAVATACGAADVTDAFKGVKVWSTNGRNNDNNHTGRNYVAKQVEEVKSVGGSAQYTLFDNVWAHSKIGSLAFQNKLKNEETGEEEYLVDWAMKQSKA